MELHKNKNIRGLEEQNIFFIKTKRGENAIVLVGIHLKYLLKLGLSHLVGKIINHGSNSTVL